MSNAKYIIIVGCGRLGSHLAGRLSRTGHSVVIIDNSSSTFSVLPTDFGGFSIEGDATELAVLKQAKIQQADMLIAATSEDNVNLMVAQMASALFGIQSVFARVYDLKREDIYRSLGINTICPTLSAVEDFFKSVKDIYPSINL